MTIHVEAAVEIKAPIREVFAYGSRLENVRQWWPAHFVYVAEEPDSPPAPGKTFTWSYRYGLIVADGRTEILRVAPQREVFYKFEVKDGTGEIRQDYRMAQSGTAFRMELDVKPPVEWLVGFLLGNHLQHEVDRALQVFKNVLEDKATHMQWLRQGGGPNHD